MRLITAALIDQLAYRYFSQSRALSKLANFPYKLAGILFVASVGWNKFSDGNTPARDPDRLAFRNSLQQGIEMGFCIERSNTSKLSR